jgi:hypothetical protein
LEKRYKAQVSIETLAIVGVIVLGGLIFAVYYLSSVNRSIDDITAIDTDLSGTIPGDNMGNVPNIPGNGGSGGSGGGFGSQCGQPGACDPNGHPQACPEGYSGEIICNAQCNWVDNCEEIVTPGVFVLSTDPTSASADINEDFPVGLKVEDYAGSTEIDTYVSVVKETNFGPIFTNKCKYNNQEVPANSEGIHVNLFSSPDGSYYTKNVSCSEEGDYRFVFTGFNENDDQAQVEFEFTVPKESPPTFSLCKTKDTPGVGSVELCVNHFAYEVNNTNGTLEIYVNQPEYNSVEENEPFCQTNTHGTICLSLGYS